MRDSANDSRAKIFLDGEEALVQHHGTPAGQKEIHAETLDLANGRAFPTPQLKRLVERIDFAAQLFSD